MASSDMGHMQFLGAVAAQDVKELERKEATYQGSWKRRGGVGAFMMLARKWDRLEQICSQQLMWPGKDKVTGPYDIFGHIQRDVLGADGTALAEVRDLRRYLLLVEAEMVARGAVPDGKFHGEDMTFIAHSDKPPAGIPVGKGGMVMESQGDGTWEWRPGTPEDGGHHARYEPRLEDGLLACPEESDYGYVQTIDPQVGTAYWIVDRRWVPQPERDHLPRLRPQLNHLEWAQLQPEYRGMYEWRENHYWLRREYLEHWGPREEDEEAA